MGDRAGTLTTSLRARPFALNLFAVAVQASECAALMLLATLLRPLAGTSVGGIGTLGWAATLLPPLFTVVIAHSLGCYRIGALRDPVAPLGRIMAVWTGAIVLFAAAAFMLGLGSDGAPRWIALTLGGGLFLLVVGRILIARLVTHWAHQGRLDRRAVIIGAGEEADSLIAALAATSPEIHVFGIFDDRGADRLPLGVGGPPRLGTISELIGFARTTHVDLLIVALPQSAETRLMEILKAVWVLPVDIRLSTIGSRLRFRPRAYSYIGTIPFLDLADRPISGWNAVAKRCFDLVVGTLALLLLSPVMIATAIAIRLDSPGPILFRQKRYGFNNEVIEVLKFRSMYHHLSDPNAKVVVTRGDPRVTRVGRFIRRASIDELPQLFNVLAGTLSIVGPRPHAVNAHTDDRLWDEVVDGYFARHRVKPGITGWAQINGWRGEIDVPEKIQRRVEYDLDYIERWSVLFDLYIVVMTPLRLLSGENAY